METGLYEVNMEQTRIHSDAAQTGNGYVVVIIGLGAMTRVFCYIWFMIVGICYADAPTEKRKHLRHLTFSQIVPEYVLEDV